MSGEGAEALRAWKAASIVARGGGCMSSIEGGEDGGGWQRGEIRD